MTDHDGEEPKSDNLKAFEKGVDQSEGLAKFFYSQAEVLLAQYKNIEQLLGPIKHEWTWPGEHCEVLLRDLIAKHLPPAFVIGKGYVFGGQMTDAESKICPEIDILIFDASVFPPIFQMGNFFIVRSESVRAIIQVKRCADKGPLEKAIENIALAKHHVLSACDPSFSSCTVEESLFTGIVCFEERSRSKSGNPRSKSENHINSFYRKSLDYGVSEWRDDRFLPDFVGALKGIFLRKLPKSDVIKYQGFASVDTDDKNIAVPYLLSLLISKIRPPGFHLPLALPEGLKPIGCLELGQGS